MADGSDRPGKPSLPQMPGSTEAEDVLRNVVLPQVYEIGQQDPAEARSLLDKFRAMIDAVGIILPTSHAARTPAQDDLAPQSEPTDDSDRGRDGRSRAETQTRLLVALEFLTLTGEAKELADIVAHVQSNGFSGEPKANVNTQLVRARDKGWLACPGEGMYAITPTGIAEFQRLQRAYGHLRQRRR